MGLERFRKEVSWPAIEPLDCTICGNILTPTRHPQESKVRYQMRTGVIKIIEPLQSTWEWHSQMRRPKGGMAFNQKLRRPME